MGLLGDISRTIFSCRLFFVVYSNFSETSKCFA